jgi:SAM-dependent methyltransferase
VSEAAVAGDFDIEKVTFQDRTREVLVSRNAGPPVIILHEIFGMTESVLAAKAMSYVSENLVRSTFQQFISTFEYYFFDLLRLENATTLLEVGAGTGVMGRWYADQGLRVTATDLAPVMIQHCRDKGLEAYEMDFLSLKFDEPFDAVFGMNCLLHVPRAELRASLASISACLKPGGVAYLGQYGGIDREGPWVGDSYEPKRFFSYSSDEAMQAAAAEFFENVDFRTIAVNHYDEAHYQALTLRRRT